MNQTGGRIRRIAVIGGGPAGLYSARLLKLARPDWEVALYDQFHPKDTFGFGVGLSFATQRNLAQSDPDTLAEIVRVAHRGHGAELHSDYGAVRMPGQETLAIARATLLQILSDHAEASGVALHVGRPCDYRDLDADVIIAADGVGSPTRRALASELGESIAVGRQYYLWCGTDFALPDALFAPVRTEHGVFTTHSYPYASDRSTFLVETDETTWRASGLADAAASVPADASDTTAIEYLQEIFAEHLDGHRLLGNRSRWARFRTVRCTRWHTDNVVVLGDAAHTAHYSVGSGTKLAMEDAIALAEALTTTSIDTAADLTAAFERYQAHRMPAVQRLQDVADRSQLWWESYPQRLHLTSERLAMSFISRAGNVGLEAFTQSTPQIAGPALAEYGNGHTPPSESIVDWVLAQPLRYRDHIIAERVVDADGLDRLGVRVETVTVDLADTWGADADDFVARCVTLLKSGAVGLRLVGPPSRAAVMRRLELAERLRLELADRDPLTVVDAPPEFVADLAAGLVSGRTDLVSLDENGTVE